MKAAAQPYVELAVTSCFSFLRGASLPEDLLKQAARLAYSGFAVTDINSLAGIVRPFRRAPDRPWRPPALPLRRA
jgi:error-prone DNA polymerase